MSKYNVGLDLEHENSLSLIVKEIKANSTILEFGSSHGRLTKHLKEQLSCQVDIVELDELAGADASKYARHSLCGAELGDIENYKWMTALKDNKYDYIIFADVLEHLYYPEKALSAVKGFLSEKGQVIISIPNFGHDGVLLELMNEEFNYRPTGLLDDTHIRFFTYTTLLKLIDDAGFVATKENAHYAEVMQTEFADYMQSTKLDMLESLEKRAFGNVYQFIFTLSPKNSINIANIQKLNKAKSSARPSKYFSKLFIKEKDDLHFSEEKAVLVQISEEGVYFNLEQFDAITELRLDPCEQSAMVQLLDFSNNILFSDSNALVQFDNNFIFNTNDPQIIFKVTDVIKSAYFKINLIPLAERFINAFVLPIVELKNIQTQKFDVLVNEEKTQKEILTEQVQNLQSEVVMQKENAESRALQIGILTEKVEFKALQIKTLKQEKQIDGNKISMLNNELQSAYNSKSWRITKPMRFLSNKLKQIRPLMLHPILLVQFFYIKLFKKIDWDQYLEGNLDLKTANVNPVIHYLKYGKKEGRKLQTVSSKEIIYPIEKIEFTSTKNEFVGKKDLKSISPLVKVIAFYLPQFHPFPENDAWWGKGFTEWTNVGKAKPNFEGHYQPHCPIHFGYYDLRVPLVMEEQAILAKEYGIHGFNYYFYWFGGRVLMETPLDQMLKNTKVDMPFCITWANENWSRRWDGQENDILIAQNHSDEDSINFIKYVSKYFKDDRYITIDGKPILCIYRANIIPNIKETAALWRAEAKKIGFPDLYLICAQSFGITSPDEFGFDASMEFPPHTSASKSIADQMSLINKNYDGCIFDYHEVVSNAVKKPIQNENYKCFRTAMLSWDNTARKQNASHIFANFNLGDYKLWLSELVNSVFYNSKYSKDEKLVFINAWNEWAEGTHLEPDNKYGYAYLQSTYDVLEDYSKEYKFLTSVPNKKYEVAVILHLHYLETWEEISELLVKRFNELPFDLYVTITSSKFSCFILEKFPEAFILLVNNKGRDILPFINVLKEISLFDYSAICKIHSKKSIYREDGDALRVKLLSTLIGENFGQSVEKFKKNSNLGLLIPEQNLIKHTNKNMTYAHKNIEMLEDILNVKFELSDFPAGSMYWFNQKALLQLLELKAEKFALEEGLVDGTLAHAVERYICVLARKNEFYVEVI